MTKGGWETPDWHTTKLSHDQILSPLGSMAVLHATGLVYRMSAKNNFQQSYPWLGDITKELIARHLDEYLHCLSLIECTENIYMDAASFNSTLLSCHLVQDMVIDQGGGGAQRPAHPRMLNNLPPNSSQPGPSHRQAPGKGLPPSEPATSQATNPLREALFSQDGWGDQNIK